MKQEMSAEQIRDRFGEDSLPDNIKDVLKDSRGFESKHTVCWLVEPNSDTSYEFFSLGMYVVMGCGGLVLNFLK